MSRRGFTLAEVLVAAGLIVLVLNFVFSPLEQARRSSAHARARLQALATARQLLDEEPTPAEGARVCDWGQGATEFAFRRSVEEQLDGTLRVTVRVEWEHQNLELARLLPPPLEDLP